MTTKVITIKSYNNFD